MDIQRARILLLLSLFAVGFMLLNQWQQEKAIVSPKKDVIQSEQISSPSSSDVPVGFTQNTVSAPAETGHTTPEDLIRVQTDVFNIKIDLNGGDVVFADLPQYPVSLDTPDDPFVLLNNDEATRYYIMQTGLIGQQDSGPDSRSKGRAKYQAKQSHFEMQPGQDTLTVSLLWSQDGINVTKRYTFYRNQYLVDVTYDVQNMTNQPWQANLYGQLKRQPQSQKKGLFAVQMYQGAAVYTDDKPYKKISFKDMKESAFKQKVEGGWAAMREHYFLSAWIPQQGVESKYYTRADENEMYTIGAISAFQVSPQSSLTVGGKAYLGPEITDDLKEISPGLELTVDYGILWPISQLLFWLLKKIFSFIGNWGWSIILLTLMIKVVFYKLSAASYKSMAKMKAVQPRIEALKARCGEDKQQFSQALLEMYRKEKINPLGGCLPILIQIPVFIALYYVLLESVELRQAPFILWINDLSIKDPFYVLPIIMGASMLLQQKMNPPPPDPMQAKIMMAMPLVFTLLFLSFPSGLVLYWVANNLLSILQQWYINKKFGTQLKTSPVPKKAT